MVQTECVTDQPMMRLGPIHLCDVVSLYPYVDQGDLSKQGQHHRGGGCCGETFVPWELLAMPQEVEAHLALDDAGHQ
jgi:hypothetical protein